MKKKEHDIIVHALYDTILSDQFNISVYNIIFRRRRERDYILFYDFIFSHSFDSIFFFLFLSIAAK